METISHRNLLTQAKRVAVGAAIVLSACGTAACSEGPVNPDTCAKIVATQELNTGIELATQFQDASGIDIREGDAGSDIHDKMRGSRIAFDVGDSTILCANSQTGQYEVRDDMPPGVTVVDIGD